MSDQQTDSGSAAAIAAADPESAHPADASASVRRWPELLLAVCVITIGLITIADGAGQPASTSASGLGAGQFPIIVGTLTTVLGAILTVQVLRGRVGHPDAAEGDVDVTTMRWWQFGVAAAALIFFGMAVDALGYPIASAITFFAVAFATGARRWLLTSAIAVVLSLGIFYLFTLLLRIQLPAGILAGVL